MTRREIEAARRRHDRERQSDDAPRGPYAPSPAEIASLEAELAWRRGETPRPKQKETQT